MELKNRICSGFTGTKDELDSVLTMLDDDHSIFPFNEYEHLICNLIKIKGLAFEQYLEIRSEYISQNPNLWIFEISAPRGFGEKFAQTYVHGKCEALKSPSKKLDTGYSGQYVIWLAVFRDQIVLWVMNSNEVLNNPLFSKGQHRGNSGNEGQLHINQDNVHLLNKYELADGDLGQLIRQAAARD